MSLQQNVNKYTSIGVPGDPAAPNQSVFYPLNLPADEDGVKVGNFCKRDSDGNITNTISVGDTVLGIARRNLSYPIDDVTVEGSLLIPESYPVMVTVKGDCFVKTSTTAAVGDTVYAGSDGAVNCGSGATGVETSWKVKTSGAANDVIIISNWA